MNTLDLLKEALLRYAMFISMEEKMQENGEDISQVTNLLTLYCRILVVLFWAVEKEDIDLPEELQNLKDGIFEDEVNAATEVLIKHRDTDKIAEAYGKFGLN